MKKLLGMLVFTCVCVVLSVGNTGCTKKTDKTDGKAGKKDVTVAADPKTADATEGEAKTITVTLKLDRGAEATKEVTFEAPTVTAKDKGVTAAKPDSIAGTAKEGKLTIEVAKDAQPGEYTVAVAGKSEGSANLSTSVKVKVAKKKEVTPEKKDKFEATTDAKELKMKQGGKDTAKVHLKLGDDLKKGATLKVSVTDKDGKDVKGVTAKADPDKMDKSGDSTVTVTAADDAAVGDYELRVDAAAEGGMPATASLKVSVKVEKK
jgi:uncharacterized membrane protein